MKPISRGLHSDRWLRLLYVLIPALLFALPFLASVYFGADPLTLANESVAYRFLYSERLLGGEGSTVWVLGGFLTTAIQNLLLAGIDTFSGLAADDLRGRIHLFAHATIVLHCLLAAGIFFVAAQSRRLLWIDRLLLALVGLGPLYLTRTVGFYYYSTPDYLLTNVVLILAAVFLFQNEWRRGEEGNPLLRCALLGCFAGIMVANKITMAPLAVVMLAPALMAGTVRVGTVMARIQAVAVCAAGVFIFVVLSFYVFNIFAFFGMFQNWMSIILNPGSQEDFDVTLGRVSFWVFAFWRDLVRYSYGYIIAFWLLSLLATLVLGLKGKLFHLRSLVVVALSLLSGIAWVYFLYKRPAGTTFFEASVTLLGLSSCVLTLVAPTRGGRTFIGVAFTVWAIVGISTFNSDQNLTSLRQSGLLADHLWRLHREVLEFANGRDVVVIHPENHFGYRGVPEFLLKGSADTPTWNVSSRGEKIVHRYAPGMSFRHEYGGTPPNAPLPERTVVYWVDLPWLEPLSKLYPTLREAIENPANEVRQWVIPYAFAGEGVKITARAVLLNEPAGSSPRPAARGPAGGGPGSRESDGT